MFVSDYSDRHILCKDPRALLREEYDRRCRKNPAYSMRAFARSLEMSQSVLSLVLSGKRNLSKKAAHKVADKIGLSPMERQNLVAYRKGSSPTIEKDVEPSANLMDLEVFHTISSWVHYGILSLLELPKSCLDSRWISKMLKVSQGQAQVAAERLVRLGLVQEKNGHWKQVGQPLRIDNRNSTAATRVFQMQLLEKAAESLENDPPEKRDFTSMTMAIDPKNVDYARERIRDFKIQLTKELESMGTPKQVYNFTIQLYPISEEQKGE